MVFAMVRSVRVILLIVFYVKSCVCEPYVIIKRMHQSNCLCETYQKKNKSKAYNTSTYLSLPRYLTLALAVCPSLYYFIHILLLTLVIHQLFVGDISEDNKVWSLTPTFYCPCQLSYISLLWQGPYNEQRLRFLKFVHLFVAWNSLPWYCKL